jgi:hypothetical protein
MPSRARGQRRIEAATTAKKTKTVQKPGGGGVSGTGLGHRSPGPLLSLRSLVLIVVAAMVAVAVGALTWWQFRAAPGVLLAGGGAFGATLKALHELVE